MRTTGNFAVQFLPYAGLPDEMNNYFSFACKLAVLGSLAALPSCEFMRITTCDTKFVSTTPATLYSSAIAFPDGYDWRKDSLGGAVATDILFFKDRREILRLRAESAGAIGKSPEMHHIVGKHLYSDYAGPGETVIKQDGEEIFRFEGREYIRDVFVKDSSVFTLGEIYSGGGYTFRKDGAAVLHIGKGGIFGRMYEDKGELCFAYYESLESSGTSKGKTYWFVHNSKAEQIIYSSDITEILAVRRMDGAINMIARSNLQQSLVWKDDVKTTLLDCERNGAFRNMEFIVAGGQLTAHAQKLYIPTKSWNDFFWARTYTMSYTIGQEQSCALCENLPAFCFAHSPSCFPSPVTVTWKNKSFTLPPEMLLLSHRAISCDENTFYLGVNDNAHGCQPVIVSRYDTLRFDFNGYFTQLCLP